MDWIEKIRTYSPYNEQEEKDKGILLECISSFDDVLTRKNGIAHMTSSAFVINESKEKMLMIYHNIYDSWSWVGGHADGETDFLEVARREAKEETGIRNIHSISPEIFALDVLPVLRHMKKGTFVPAHLHLSLTYLFVADEKDPLVVKADENSGVKWIPIEEVNRYSNEPHMKKVYEKLIKKLKELK